MNSSEFGYWLKGFLEGRDNILSKEDVEKIVSKARTVDNSSWYNPGVWPSPYSPNPWVTKDNTPRWDTVTVTAEDKGDFTNYKSNCGFGLK